MHSRTKVDQPLRFLDQAGQHIWCKRIYCDYDFSKDNGIDYTDWRVGVTRDVGPVSLELAYTDTDLSKSECSSGCSARGWLSAKYSF